MGSPERGGDGRYGAIEYALWQRFRAGSLRPKEPEKRGFVVPRENSDGPPSAQPDAGPDSVVTASLDATVEAVVEWSLARAVELLADVAHPGLGRVISVALKVKEVLGDAEALASPGSPRDLHVPLLGVADGIELDLNVHLPGTDETGDHTPPVSGFVAPGADGLFGGWQIEIDRRPKAAGKDAPQSEQDAWTVLEESIVRLNARQAARSRRYGWRSPAELTLNLAASVPTDDPLRRAVIMREAASSAAGPTAHPARVHGQADHRHLRPSGRHRYCGSSSLSRPRRSRGEASRSG